MTKLYKLTDEQGRTRAGEDNELTWAVGVEHRTAGTGTRLCTADVIHAYEHPLIAVLMNPVHAMFNPTTMRLFVAEGEIVARLQATLLLKLHVCLTKHVSCTYMQNLNIGQYHQVFLLHKP